MSIITYSSTLDYRYLMNKSKSDLAHLVLDYAKWYQEEKDKNTPRPTYGLKIVLDKSLPKDVALFVDNQGKTLGKVEF